VAIKILDNFVLGIAGLRFHHRIQELTPHGLSTASRSGFRPNARGHRHHKDLPCQGPMRSVFRTSSPPQGCRHGVRGTAIKLTDRGGTLETETSRDLLLVGVFPDRDVYLNSPRSM